MAILAGQIVTADQLNHLQPMRYYAQGTTPFSISTTTFVAIPNCSITLSTDTAAVYSVQANFSYHVTTPAATVFTRGALFLDGAQLSGESRWSEGSTGMDASDFNMAPKAWGGTLSAAGTHTFDLRAAVSSAGLVYDSTGFTDITVVIYEIV